MRKIKGNLFNTASPVFAKVHKFETDNNLFDPEAWYILEDTQDSLAFSVKTGLIVPPGFINEFSTSPFFELENWDDRPNIGDIVNISQNCCTVVFDVLSTSNSLFLSEKCDCHCIMCPQLQTGLSDEDCFSIAIKTINLLPINIQWIGFTGGEPTINWKNLIYLINRCVTLLPNVKIHLLTNGHVFKYWEKVDEIASLLKNRIYISIPLYSDNQEDHDKIVGKKGAFYETISGILNLANSGLPIELRNVLLPQNMNRLLNWADFVYKTMPFVNCVALMGIEHEGQARIFHDSLMLETIKCSKLLIDTSNAFIRYNINFRLYNFPLCNLPKCLWHYSHKSISEWKRTYSTGCDNCSVKSNCGGLFESSLNNKHIHPIKEEVLV